MQELIRITAIKERAERIGLSLPQLADEAGQSSSTIYRWLSGEVDPRRKHYGAVCDQLDMVLRRHEAHVLHVLQHLAAKGQEQAA